MPVDRAGLKRLRELSERLDALSEEIGAFVDETTHEDSDGTSDLDQLNAGLVLALKAFDKLHKIGCQLSNKSWQRLEGAIALYEGALLLEEDRARKPERSLRAIR